MLNLRRLLFALPILLVAIAGTVYFLVPRETDATIRNAAIVDTPDVQGRKLGLQPGQLAPNFEVSTNDGRRVKLSDFRGRAVLINFWARWCTSCLSEMPEIKALQAERGESLAVIAVNAGETRAEAQEFIDFLAAPAFTFAMDPGLRLSDAYRVRGLPNSIFIDSTGVVQAVYAGHADRNRLNAYVDAAFKAQPPAPQPLVLRPVSDLPRENILNVERKGDVLTFRSRRLRCDVSYCADGLLDVLKAGGFPDVSDARFVKGSDGERELAVKFDSAKTSENALVMAIVAEIVAQLDPVYGGTPQVVFGR